MNKTNSLKKDKLILSVLIIFFTLYFAFSVTYFCNVSAEIREDVVRLHILANSDSEEDQTVKLKVRDALLNKNTALLTDGVNKENAGEYFKNSKAELLKTAEKTLKENGFNYKADMVLCREYYPTREYGGLTFPAGIYTSVKIVLGEGKGHNWWCVMFPPLCVPAACGKTEVNKKELDDYISANGKKLLESGKKYKVKFKLAEIYESIFKTGKNTVKNQPR